MLGGSHPLFCTLHVTDIKIKTLIEVGLDYLENSTVNLIDNLWQVWQLKVTPIRILY